VPLLVPESPYIGTGSRRVPPRDAGDVGPREGDGHGREVSGDQISVEYKRPERTRLGVHCTSKKALPPGPSSAASTPEHLHQQKVWSKRATR